MNHTSKNYKRTILFVVLLLSVFTFVALAEMIITIKVSPNILNLKNNGQVVTIHTDISYNSVVGASVTLNGITIYYWKSEDRGNFVAKFNINDIKNLPLKIDEYNTLTLKGTTVNGELFIGSEQILVISPK